jgi:putative addiction module killer protein
VVDAAMPKGLLDIASCVNHDSHMVEIVKSSTFDAWLSGLRDRKAVARILLRIERLAHGNPGDVKPVGEGISELRIDHGPGYRIYWMRKGRVLIVLLCGGNKATQDADILAAKRIAAQWRAQSLER